MQGRLTLISHAPTEAQKLAAFPLDEPIEKGEIERISAIGWMLPRAQHVRSGPERRAQETAQTLGLSADIDVGLRDCDYGAWRGRRLDDLQSDDPEGIAAWLTDPSAAPHGGESYLNLLDRVGQWLVKQIDAGHTIAVTHPAIVRSAIVHVLDAPASAFWRVDIPPLTLTDLRYNGKVWTIRSTGVGIE